ncbi:hypothetical protein D9757_006990 [Collybiopsis confluens]|uniref:Cytochrome c oxidase assembly protein COX19 n=1 Tax=Collybiopsis confluens TaxID=2823264 RepID=A0A8H5FQX2_9AGAR|nr:hypothetical protein D9757_014057 [Collybiopsis confluens]KAF5384005.1 hypothetical protein D9757_006990 [Collybiopsis confluens]
MSFGRPPTINSGFKVTPPDRGSFPLDHYAECKEQMTLYMNCLNKNANTSEACRDLTKQYLDCRMRKGLMQKEEWASLGLSNVDKGPPGGDGSNRPANKI